MIKTQEHGTIILNPDYLISYEEAKAKQAADYFQRRSKENRDKYNKQHPDKEDLS